MFSYSCYFYRKNQQAKSGIPLTKSAPHPRKVNCQQLTPWLSFWSNLLSPNVSLRPSTKGYSKVSLCKFEKENPVRFWNDQFLKTAAKYTYIYCVIICCINAPKHAASGTDNKYICVVYGFLQLIISLVPFWLVSVLVSFIFYHHHHHHHICHEVGPLVDSFRSHVSRSLFKGLS